MQYYSDNSSAANPYPTQGFFNLKCPLCTNQAFFTLQGDQSQTIYCSKCRQMLRYNGATRQLDHGFADSPLFGSRQDRDPFRPNKHTR